MAVDYTIQAEVVDIGADTPKATDAFLVDTNVWFWMAYPTAGQSAIPYQLTSYPSYVNSALGNGAKICRTGLSLAELLSLAVDEPTTDSALARFQNKKVDGYDLFILETMKSNAVLQVITDDGDFATVSGIQVFTANRNVISSARAQGRLLTR